VWAQVGNRLRSKSKVGDEVAIHDVQVKPIGAYREDLFGFRLHVGEIASE